MIMDPIVSSAILAVAALVGLGMASIAALKGWAAYLDFKKLELARGLDDGGYAPITGTIEIADLKERVRKLEAIASGIDL